MLWFGLIAVACRASDEACKDCDGDGFERPSDCDDGNAAVAPTATEVCNGIDDDCDGLVDDDDPGRDVASATLAWFDADLDGWGDADAIRWVCALGPGYVSVAGDCEPDRPEAHPGAQELCGEGVDEDCDGLIGAEDPDLDLTGLTPSWQDADGDGFGNGTLDPAWCLDPPGSVGNGDDCDDADPYLHPDTTWLADIDGDGAGAGEPVAGVGCTAPSAGVVPSGELEDCEPDDASISPKGFDRHANLIDDDCDGVVDEYEKVDVGTLVTSEWAVDATCVGVSSMLGGLDVDGIPLLLVACDGPDLEWWRVQIGVADAGEPWLVSTPLLPLAPVAASIDTDRDGWRDLIVGLPQWGGSGAIGAFGLFGDSEVLTGESSEGVARVLFGEVGDFVGGSLDVGDLDGDGLEGVVAGAAIDEEGPVLGMDGPWLVDLSFADVGWRIEPEYPGQGFGSALAVVQDSDGDGLGEVVVGAPSSLWSGSAFWFSPAPMGAVTVKEASAVVVGGGGFTNFGFALSDVGDVTGDGLVDTSVGAPHAQGNAGVNYVFSGLPVDGISASDATARTGGDPDRAQSCGIQQVELGDADGDGFGDLVFGCLESFALWFGPVSGFIGVEDLPLRVEYPYAAAGLPPKALDATGDGSVDLLLGWSMVDAAGAGLLGGPF